MDVGRKPDVSPICRDRTLGLRIPPQCSCVKSWEVWCTVAACGADTIRARAMFFDSRVTGAMGNFPLPLMYLRSSRIVPQSEAAIKPLAMGPAFLTKNEFEGSYSIASHGLLRADNLLGPLTCLIVPECFLLKCIEI